MNQKIKGPWFTEIATMGDAVPPPAKLKAFLDVDTYPEWLVNAGTELFQQAMPSARVALFKTGTPKSVGV
jgi:hypothetical protein